MLRQLVLLAAFCNIEAEAIERMNPDFERLKQQLIGTWSFEEEGKSYDATFEAVSHGQALWSETPASSPSIIPMATPLL